MRKQKNINIQLFLLLSFNFIFEIFRYIFQDFSSTHLILLSLEGILILYFLIFSKKNDKRLDKIEFLLIGFFLYIIITFFARYIKGLNVKNSILSMITDFTSLLMMIVYYYAIFRVSLKKQDKELLLMSYLYMTLILIGYGLIFQFNEIQIAFTSSNAYDSNFSSFFINRNGFGIYLLIFYMTFLFQSKFYKDKISKDKYYLNFMIICFSILMTLSRTAIASTLLFTFLFLLNKIYYYLKIKSFNTKHIKYLVIGIILLIGLLSIVFLNMNIGNIKIIDFILTKAIRIQYSDAGRLKLWKIGIENWNQNKLFGMGSFEAQKTINVKSFHNTIIEVLVRNGMLGLVFKLIILGTFIRYHFKFDLRNKKQKIYFFMFWITLFFAMQFEARLLFKMGFREILYLFGGFIFNQEYQYTNGNLNKSIK